MHLQGYLSVKLTRQMASSIFTKFPGDVERLVERFLNFIKLNSGKFHTAGQ